MLSRIRRLLFYYTVSLATFAGNVFGAWLLMEYFQVQQIPAITAGFILQTVTAFFVNRRWTFEKQTKISRGLTTTLAIQVVALLIAILGTEGGMNILGLNFISSRIISGLIAGLWGYTMDSYLTFGLAPFT
ncbi:GtrA family protein [Candidatus Kuenenbacteria bacterium]|nr:GtrA family protein [Candidatus Kuenenbacteria bacterium]